MSEFCSKYAIDMNGYKINVAIYRISAQIRTNENMLINEEPFGLNYVLQVS